MSVRLTRTLTKGDGSNRFVKLFEIHVFLYHIPPPSLPPSLPVSEVTLSTHGIDTQQQATATSKWQEQQHSSTIGSGSTPSEKQTQNLIYARRACEKYVVRVSHFHFWNTYSTPRSISVCACPTPF